ncbi:hypothetical protein EV715DRAFT_277220 [Schizophyllum commune]
MGGFPSSSDKSSVIALARDTRTLVYQVTHSIMPLWQVGSVEECNKCFVDILQGHFYACNLGRVLHGDISEASALARRGADGMVAGILHDWDLSCFIEGEGIGKQLAPLLRSRTIPFMAIDLQRAADGTCVAADHRHCHDLESFFWLLLWAVLHFDLENKCRLICTYEQWTGDWAGSNSFKWNFLHKAGILSAVMKNALDMWKGTVKRWVIPLARMICDARERSTRWDDEAGKVFDDSIYAKELTFETFMHTIKQTPREWAHGGRRLR